MADKTMLIVEDDADVAGLLRTVFERNGFGVETVDSGEEALKRVDLKSFGVILLDLMLPRADGLEVCRRLKSGSQSKNTPVVVITGLDVPGTSEKCFIAGAEEVVFKPFDLDDLVSKVNKVCSPPAQ